MSSSYTHSALGRFGFAGVSGFELASFGPAWSSSVQSASFLFVSIRFSLVGRSALYWCGVDVLRSSQDRLGSVRSGSVLFLPVRFFPIRFGLLQFADTPVHRFTDSPPIRSLSVERSRVDRFANSGQLADSN